MKCKESCLNVSRLRIRTCDLFCLLKHLRAAFELKKKGKAALKKFIIILEIRIFSPKLKKVYISGENLQSLKNKTKKKTKNKLVESFMGIFAILNDIFCIKTEDSGKVYNKVEHSVQLGIRVQIFVLLLERYIQEKVFR